MSRRKTTVYVDSDVLTATKVLAAVRESSESQVVEEALRAYLRTGDAAFARADLSALLDRLAGRVDLGEDAAMTVALEEVGAVRAARRARTRA